MVVVWSQGEACTRGSELRQAGGKEIRTKAKNTHSGSFFVGKVKNRILWLLARQRGSESSVECQEIQGN